jgi:serpin B
MKKIMWFGSLALVVAILISMQAILLWRTGENLAIGETVAEENIAENLPAENLGEALIEFVVTPDVSALNTSDATPEKTDALVENMNRFAFDIYSRLASRDKNTFFSPYSLYIPMAMLYEGTRGETAAELERTLGIPSDPELRRPALAELQRRLAADNSVALRIANAAWPQAGFPFYESYLDTLRTYYLATVKPLDFGSNPEGAAEEINRWAAEQTENLIRKIVSAPEDINELTVLVLANATYFKANWLYSFDSALTEDEPFYLPDGSTVEVPMMRFNKDILENARFLYCELQNVKVLKLFYAGENYSMLLLLPEDRSKGIDWLLNVVDLEFLKNAEQSLHPSLSSEIKIPRFEFRSSFDLIPALMDMGVRRIFGGGDFSAMSPVEGLFVNKIKQETYVRTNEEGTEAAAVTVIGVVLGIVPSPPTFTFIADHPFMFVIKSESTGAILFIGAVVDPSKA